MGSIYKRKWKEKAGQVHESDVWWIKYYKDGKPIRESSESSKESEAKNLLKKREGAAANGQPLITRSDRITIDELLGDLETEYTVNKRDTIKDLKARIRLHIKPYFGGRRAAQIRAADIRKFVSERQTAGASNGEINRELSAIKRAFNLAIDGEKLLHKPKIRMLKEGNARKGFFEREQFEAVRSFLPAHLKAAVTFAYITGWRIKSEVMRLRWSQVNSETAIVRLDAGESKNEEPREFPFTDELKTLLEEQGGKADALLEAGTVVEYVFFHEDGRQIRDFRKSWRKACKAADLADEQEIGKTKSGRQS